MNQESPGFSRGEQVNDESLLAATFAALDAAVVECDRLRGERDRARYLAAALMDEERANCPR